MTRFFVIVVDLATDDQIEAVQKVVQDATEFWWHRMTNVWIVGDVSTDGTAATWRDRIKEQLAAGVTILVISLPASPNWAARGPDIEPRMKWLKDNLSK